MPSGEGTFTRHGCLSASRKPRWQSQRKGKFLNFRNIRAIAGKEIYHLIRDFRSLDLAFAVPLLLILLFGYALSLDVEHIETVVVDSEQTGLSRDFIRRLGASPYFRIAAHLPDTAAVTEALDHGRAMLAIIIPTGWTADLRADRETTVQIILDGSDPNFAGIARAYITSFIETYNRKLLAEFLDRQGMEKIRPPWRGGSGSGLTRIWRVGTSSSRGSSRSSS